jgi:hypothetical protein
MLTENRVLVIDSVALILPLNQQIVTSVLEESLRHYHNSPVFRFIQGRVFRGKGEAGKALRAFEVSEHCSTGMKALSHLSLCKS